MSDARARIRPVKLAHCVLRTNRYEEMVRWYKTVLEAEAAFENPVVAFLRYDDEHHRVAIARMPGLSERPLDVTGVDHIAFTYASLGDLLATYERIKAHGIAPSTAIHHGPTLSLYYLDPDRNQIELQVDVFETRAQEQAWFASERFSKNPIGVLFDVEQLLARWKNGEPERELKQPISGPLPPPDTFAPH